MVTLIIGAELVSFMTIEECLYKIVGSLFEKLLYLLSDIFLKKHKCDNNYLRKSITKCKTYTAVCRDVNVNDVYRIDLFIGCTVWV